LIVTTIPYHCSRQEKSIWLDRGSTIRRQTGMPWIDLHHVPAKTGAGVSGEESEAAEVLAAYRPDYFVSGHEHAFPYACGQSWNWARCPCWCPHRRHRRNSFCRSVGRTETFKQICEKYFSISDSRFAVPALAQEKAASPAVPNPFQPIPAGPALVQQLEVINEKFDEAFNKHDASAVAAFYTANAMSAHRWGFIANPTMASR
jgi:hypothetical protein